MTNTTSKIKKETIVILDAHAIIHRAYHALPSFTNSSGVPTGALYGLCAMLIRIIEELDPTYIIAAYDLPKPTFRHHTYDGYKAKRVKTDDDLKLQLELSRAIFQAFHIPCLDAEGFEADDVIGTLVEQFKTTPKTRIIIASGDMDTLQLVDGEKVQVYTLKKGIHDTALYDETTVVKRYGFSPRQLVDYKGLRGDPSDNIIGIPGIGEKTATTIIQQFGSIEGLYTRIEKDPEAAKNAGISSRITELLLKHKDDALFSKTLATIRRDAPVTYSLPDRSYKEQVDTTALLEIISTYEFRSLISRIKKLFSIQEKEITENIDQSLLRRASIALWVLYSEDTTPTLETILTRTKKNTLKEAYEVLEDRLKEQNLHTLFEKIELPLIPIVDAMEKRGIMIDTDHFLSLEKKMKATLARIEKEVEKCTGGFSINLNSPKQLSELLFTKLGLKAKGKRKASGAFTTNAETLDLLKDAHPVVPLILEYRETQKLLSTYVSALLEHQKEDKKIHAQFLQHGTSTGRFSSAHPNLQNIPNTGDAGKEIRKGFIASPEYVFVASDYSQIELRVLAILSNDERLIETFKKGEDIHTAVASKMFSVPFDAVTKDMRRIAKVINFGILFGMGVTALAKNLNTDRASAQKFYTDYFETFPGVARYIEATKKQAHDQGYTETLFGRRRYLPQINASAPFLKAFAERMASNAPIQGTEADILKIAMLLIEQDLVAKGFREKVHLLLQVHDELVYEVHHSVVKQVIPLIREAMVAAFSRSPIKIPLPVVPLTVSIEQGPTLGELSS